MGPLSSIKFLGDGFNRWVYPTVLFIMVALTITNGWKRILNCIGKSQYGFDEDYTDMQTIQGKSVVDKHRKMLKEIQSGLLKP